MIHLPTTASYADELHLQDTPSSTITTSHPSRLAISTTRPPAEIHFPPYRHPPIASSEYLEPFFYGFRSI